MSAILTPVPGAAPRYDDDGNEIVVVATCGHCGRSWNDAAIGPITPVPSGRCPFEYEHRECLDEHKGGCEGAVVMRPSLTGTGTPIPRCDAHWEERLQFQEEHERVFPDSDIPPAWFDPEAAGERWNDE